MIFAERFIELMGVIMGIQVFLGTMLVVLAMLIVFLVRDPAPVGPTIPARINKDGKRRNFLRLICRPPSVLRMEIS